MQFEQANGKKEVTELGEPQELLFWINSRVLEKKKKMYAMGNNRLETLIWVSYENHKYVQRVALGQEFPGVLALQYILYFTLSLAGQNI